MLKSDNFVQGKSWWTPLNGYWYEFGSWGAQPLRKAAALQTLVHYIAKDKKKKLVWKPKSPEAQPKGLRC